jgi:hypothetical protein
MTARGVGAVRLGDSYVETLQRAGQPAERNGRVWKWKVAGKGSVVAVLSPQGKVALVAESGRKVTTRGKGSFIRGKTFTAVAGHNAKRAAYLKLAGLR